MKIKIAVPTRNGKIDDHFGHCEYYTIISLSENNVIEKTESFKAPQGCGCRSGIAHELRNIGVGIMLAGNMGMGAFEKITSTGIKVYRGCSREVSEVVDTFLKNELTDSGESCRQHQHHHEHGGDCRH